METYSIEQLVEYSAAQLRMVQLAVADQIVEPIVRGKGHGHSSRFSLPQVAAFGVGQVMRRMGLSGKNVNDVISFISRFSDEQLEKQFAKPGRPCCLIVLPGRSAMLEFVPSATINNPDLIQKSLDKLFAVPVAVDVGRFYAKLKEHVAKKKRATKRPAHAVT